MNFIDMLYEQIMYKEFDESVSYSKEDELFYREYDGVNSEQSLITFIPKIGGRVNCVLSETAASINHVPIKIYENDIFLMESNDYAVINIKPFARYDIFAAETSNWKHRLYIWGTLKDKINQYYSIVENT